MNDILTWLYDCRPAAPGPRLLRTVIQEARTRMVRENPDDSSTATISGVPETPKLSRGASIMLERTVTWLESYAQEMLDAKAEPDEREMA